MENLLNFLPDTPLVSFTVLILVALFIPPIFEKFRLPGLVGLLAAGVFLGPNGLQFLNAEDDTIHLLSDAGKIYLMFVAGLEIDLDDFRKKKNRSLSFGLATFAIPLLIGILVGRLFGLGWNTSVLIGSLLASHTLLGYPIVNRLGVVKNEAVTVTIGATIFTDISALLVLAICVSVHAGDFTPLSLLIRLGTLALYSAVVLLGIDWIGKEYFRRTGDEESNQFLFVLAAVFLASVGAQLIDIEKIVGAFLAGLSINSVVGKGPVKEKVEFVGATLFIPFFFVGMGLLLDIPKFVETITSASGLGLTVAIVSGLIGSKFLAALVTKFLYRYTWDETLTMWSLSLPQVAATLAAALAAFQAENELGETLISEGVLNTVIVMMLITSVLGPVLTARFARNITVPSSPTEVPSQLQPEVWEERDRGSSLERRHREAFEGQHRDPHHSFTVIVPIYNPSTQKYLIQMGAMLVRHESGVLIPLSIAKAHVHMDEPKLDVALGRSRGFLEGACGMAREFGVEAKPVTRIDDNVASAIGRVARERDASLVVMGLGRTTGLRSRLFGNLIDRVLWSSHCPVVVTRLLDEPVKIQRVLVPVKNFTPSEIRVIRFAQLFAETHEATVTLLHVCDRATPPSKIAAFEAKLERIVKAGTMQKHLSILTVASDDVARAILDTAHSYELAILRSVRRRTVGGLAVSDVTTQVLKKLSCSLILFGEPHR
ncbi:MAG: cation:proton antiporter [Cyanobacteriota bacterium]|nr:cation:proton antiporter [Cyanobacteriota bacterium]